MEDRAMTIGETKSQRVIKKKFGYDTKVAVAEDKDAETKQHCGHMAIEVTDGVKYLHVTNECPI